MTDGAALQIQQRFEVIYCCNCSMPFAVPGTIRGTWIDQGTTFYCPVGHSQHYTETTVQKLRKEIENADRRAKWHAENAANERAARERTERRLSAAKGQQTKLRNRVKHGVCPCCTRTFSNLQRHMANQHPEFTPEVLND
jgi:hypothetical protein